MPVMPVKTGESFMREVASVVRDHVGNAIRPIAAQNAALIQQNAILIQRIEKLEALQPVVVEGPAGAPGKDGDPGAPGQDGKSITIEDVLPELIKHHTKHVEPTLIGRLETFEKMTAKRLEQLISDLPKPKDGKDGEPGKDGANIVSALIDRMGNLILNLSNGQSINVGMVVGKDGAPGPAGRDGLGIDNLEVNYDGDRTATVCFSSGEVKKEYPLIFPFMIYRGVWKETEIYKRGDSVTRGGSCFIALTDTDKEPETSKEWQLAVKRGHNGKDGSPGKEGKQGKPGRDGRDLTQLGPDGSKW